MGNIQTKADRNGYRVIKVAPRSPAKKAGLVEFVDFIIGIDDFATETHLTGNYDVFFDGIKRNENQLVTLNVYNILTRATRKVPVIPHKSWEKADSLLGILVRYEDYSSAHERVLKVISVKPKSPAASIGLDPGNDYILGASNQLSFISPSETIEPEQMRPMEIFVYNAKRKRVWSTSVTPLSNWEMGGYLGCEFAPEDSSSLPYEPETEINRKGKESGSRFKNEKLVRKLEQASNDKKEINIDMNVQSHTDLTEKPPTDSELGRRKTIQANSNDTILVRDKRSCSFDVSDEVTSQRIKLHHNQNTRKGSFRLVSHPFNESGNASLSHLPGPMTLENLEEEEDTGSPRNQDRQDFKNPEKQGLYQTQASLQTVDQSITEGPLESDDPKLKSQQAPNSLLSISSDVTKETQSGKENQEDTNPNHYRYFSKKLGKDYIIKPVDLFNFSEICSK